MESDSFYKKQLGAKLNRDKVKLWEPPFTVTDGCAGEIPQSLTTKYSEELGVTCERVVSLLEELRAHAIQKLKERELFQESGKATLKIKCSGLVSSQNSQQSLETDLTCQGSDLRLSVSQLLNQPPDHLKLICRGKVIQDGVMLKDQNIKNGSQILVLCLSVSQDEAKQQDQLSSELHNLRHAAQLLSDTVGKDEDFEGMDIQVADQTGRPINLPLHEKKALTLAMSLHEKGRQALKNRVIPLALPLLLEADKEFKQCSVDLLNQVDNYAILCLDIVWCYLCLQNVDDLPDAEERLRTSELFFHKSYGSDLGRLMAVKGTSGEELALFTRLHLLQGIVAFHQNKLDIAHKYLTQAESELAQLHVDEEKLMTVMSMGFTENEARLGLRACSGDVQNTVTHIMRRREEKKENAEKLKAERRKKKLAKHLGKTANGASVNVDGYENLVGMGFPKGASAEALRQSNNDVNLALEVLQQHPEFLDLPDPEPRPKVPITDSMIAEVTALGFEPEMAKRALTKHHGDITKAISELVDKGGQLEPSEPAAATPGTSGATQSQDPISRVKTDAEKQQDREAVQNLVKDLPEDEEDYLNLTLDEERDYLTRYMALLQTVSRARV